MVYRTKYFFTYVDGVLTVSNKKKQGILFDQELKNIPATSPPILLNGHSIDLDSNQTTRSYNHYEVEDDQVARLLVTANTFLRSHWKFDETKYAEAYDEKGRNSGTLRDLITVGSNAAWEERKVCRSSSLEWN